MKATKIYIILLSFCVLAACSEDDLTGGESNLPSFVRFNFLVNNNDEPLEFPDKDAGEVPQSEYLNQAIRTLKIPVTLSAPKLSQTVTVDYSLETELEPEMYEVSPEQLSFSGNQLTDTIYVDFKERWEPGDQLEFKLTGISDDRIQIGALNSKYPNDTFRVSLGEISTTYKFDTNRLEIEGTLGEQVDFVVEFPNGYFPSEVDEEQIFDFLDGFDYELEKLEEGLNQVTYRITINEDLGQDDVSYQSIISLLESDRYSPVGTSTLQIIKPIKSNRDLQINTAAHFYDVEDQFYRTYGENWLDHDNDGICEWRSFIAFTHPIQVSADDENAVLFSDNDTEDPADDIYYHAFQIGFTSPLAGRTTNPFNLQRWFDNEATDADVSPGFNISPALEFFPTGGTSATTGRVMVVPQFISISNKEGKTYTLAISGEGEYREVLEGEYEIKLELKLKNNEIFGGTVTSQYYIYNNRNYEDPAPLTEACVETVEI